MNNDITESSITHKELLTFSNLCNLEWEFVNLEAIKNGRVVSSEGTQVQSTRLHDLLNPELFLREDAEGKFMYYPYMREVESRDDVEDEDIAVGLAAMRREAGIAMEYLEKMGEGEEGEFLKDWEVIYGGDNYKVANDYLTSKWEIICQMFAEIDDIPEDEKPKPDEPPFDSREEAVPSIKVSIKQVIE